MSKTVLGVHINVPGIEVALIDMDTNLTVPGTTVFQAIDPQESLENLLNCWVDTIEKCPGFNRDLLIGLGIPGPFDYEKGISLMKNQQKFDALYKVNVKELLAERLGVPAENIRLDNSTPCFLRGEVASGAGKDYANILSFTLNTGLGSALYSQGVSVDGHLWNKPFRDGIAEDYLGIQWISRRYEEFTGMYISDLKELTEMAENDDGLGQLVFNEYGENFFKFLIEQIEKYDPETVLIGGHNNAWDLFIPHVKDRLGDKNVRIPILQAELGDDATLIVAAKLWS